MVRGSESHSRSQVSVANPWVDRIGDFHGDFQVPPPDWLVEIAWQSHRRCRVLLITTLPRTVDPRVPPLNSIVLDQRRGQKVRPCVGKTTSGTWYT